MAVNKALCEQIGSWVWGMVVRVKGVLQGPVPQLGALRLWWLWWLWHLWRLSGCFCVLPSHHHRYMWFKVQGDGSEKTARPPACRARTHAALLFDAKPSSPAPARPPNDHTYLHALVPDALAADHPVLKGPETER